MGFVRAGFISVGLAALLVVSCGMLAQPDVNAMSDFDVCRVAAINSHAAQDQIQPDWPSNALEQEISKRDLVKNWEIVRVKAKEASLGMSECALLLAWGPPNRINQAAKTKQYVYYGKYVYVVKGKVLGFE